MAARDTNLGSVEIMVTKINLERLATRSLGLAHGIARGYSHVGKLGKCDVGRS